MNDVLDPYVQPHTFANPAEVEAEVRAAAAAEQVSIMDLDETDLFGSGLRTADIASLVAESLGFDEVNKRLRSNGLLGSALDANGVLHVPVDLVPNGAVLFEGATPLAYTRLKLQAASIDGLDSFTELSLTKLVSQATFETKVRLGHLGVSVTVGIELSPPDEVDGLLQGGGSLSKNVTVGFDLYDLFVNASTLVALNDETLPHLQLGSLIRTPSACIASTVYAGVTSRLQVESPPARCCTAQRKVPLSGR